MTRATQHAVGADLRMSPGVSWQSTERDGAEYRQGRASSIRGEFEGRAPDSHSVPSDWPYSRLHAASV